MSEDVSASLCFSVCAMHNRLTIFVFELVFKHESTIIPALISVHACAWICFVLRSINKPARFNSFVPIVGRALPSHYSGSTTSLRLRASLSRNLSFLSLPLLVIFLFHSLRQLPSPSGTQSILITFFFLRSFTLLSVFFVLLVSLILLCASIVFSLLKSTPS